MYIDLFSIDLKWFHISLFLSFLLIYHNEQRGTGAARDPVRDGHHVLNETIASRNINVPKAI